MSAAPKKRDHIRESTPEIPRLTRVPYHQATPTGSRGVALRNEKIKVDLHRSFLYCISRALTSLALHTTARNSSASHEDANSLIRKIRPEMPRSCWCGADFATCGPSVLCIRIQLTVTPTDRLPYFQGHLQVKVYNFHNSQRVTEIFYRTLRNSFVKFTKNQSTIGRARFSQI